MLQIGLVKWPTLLYATRQVPVLPFIRSPGLAHLTSTWGCAWPALLGPPGLSGLPTLPGAFAMPAGMPGLALSSCLASCLARCLTLFCLHPQIFTCGKPMSLEIAVRATQPLAEQSQAERSEALLREAQLPPKGAGAEGAPELREGFKQKLGCDSTTCDAAVPSQQPGSAGTCAQQVLDIIIMTSCNSLRSLAVHLGYLLGIPDDCRPLQ